MRGHERRALPNVGLGHVAMNVVERVDGVARPVGLAQLLVGQEQDAATQPAALSQKLVPLAVGRDAQQRQGHEALNPNCGGVLTIARPS